jgi:hypothetical protein
MRLRDYPMTPVIARRTLDYHPQKGRSRVVLLEVGRPARDPKDAGGWYCPYRVSGVGRARRFVIEGGDSLQALILALAALSMDITGWNTREKVLSWHGDRRWLGLQVYRALDAEVRQIARGLPKRRRAR